MEPQHGDTIYDDCDDDYVDYVIEELSVGEFLVMTESGYEMLVMEHGDGWSEI